MNEFTNPNFATDGTNEPDVQPVSGATAAQRFANPCVTPTQWPRTTAEATALFAQDEDAATWFAELPEGVRKTGAWNCAYLYRQFHQNTLIARNLEHLRGELEAIHARLCLELEAHGLTFADLRAFDCVSRGVAPFSLGGPDYVLPKAYRRADVEGEE